MERVLAVALFLCFCLPTAISQQPNFSSFPIGPFSSPSYSSPKLIIDTSVQSTNFVQSLWIPSNFLILNYSYWVVSPAVVGTSKHFDLCHEQSKIALLNLYNYSSCDEAVVRWNGTIEKLNQTERILVDDYQVPIQMADLGEWYLFDMCFFCKNSSSFATQQILSNLYYNQTQITTLWQNSCGGENNLLLYAYQNLHTICYCTSHHVYATSCNAMQLFWAPVFFFIKNLFHFSVACVALCISIYAVIIPRVVHIIRKSINRKALERQEQAKLFFKSAFSERNWIILFAELCYFCHVIQPIVETIFYWIVGYRVIKILPRTFGLIFWFCSSEVMINIWIKSIVESIFMKEPKWAIAVRVICSILPYAPVALIICALFIVGFAVKQFQNMSFGISYLIIFLYVFAFSVVSIIVGSILFCNLRKGRRDIHLCNVKFTKYLFLSLFLTFLMSIVFIHEALPLIIGYSVTGEWFYMYNVTFVDLITIIGVTPYMYAAFSYEEWRQCYLVCCPCLPEWEVIELKLKKKKQPMEDIEKPSPPATVEQGQSSQPVEPVE